MNKEKVHIIGAGLAGLLAGNMLRHRSVILEKQPGLPNNHHALLRFRSGTFGAALGIPFRRVRMIKAVYGDNSNPIKNDLNYSRKTTGELRTDRSLPVGVVKEDRYVAPPNLIEQMASVCEINYNHSFEDCDRDLLGKILQKPDDPPCISTIPMPTLMILLDYPYKDKANFRSLQGSVITAVIENCDAYATYYFPDHNSWAYRASITGDRLIIEGTDTTTDGASEKAITGFIESAARYYANLFGIKFEEIHMMKFHRMKYAKILPIDEDIRKDFMHWATMNFNIYSLGRFATWRPGLLLDDLVQDVTLISQWIMKGGKYNAAKHWS